MAKAAKKVDGRRRYKVRLWGGFVDNVLHSSRVDTGFGGFGTDEAKAIMPAVFTSRVKARKQYEDVRAIEIRELGPNAVYDRE